MMNYRRKYILFFVLGGIFLGFVCLTILVSLFPVSVIDHKFSEEIQEHHYPVLDILMKWVSWPGSMPQSIGMVLITSLLFYLVRLKREAIFVVITLASGLISYSLKLIVDRPRPSSNLIRIIEAAKYQSFPSGHVLFYVVFFGFLIIVVNHVNLFTKRFNTVITLFCTLMIFTIPFSRIYLGAHWFTDVLGSALLGIVALFTISYFYLKGA